MLSAVHQGVAFEQRSLKLLSEGLSMSLRRVGGKSDGGVDLLGWWYLPRHCHLEKPVQERNRLRVLAQCKAEKRKTSPKYIRELEGVMARFSTQQQFPIVALFISESPFTKATLLRAHSSSFPFFLLHVPPIQESQDSLLGTAVWNPSLSRILGDDVQVRWEIPTNGGPGRPGVWYQVDGSWTRLKSWAHGSSPASSEPAGEDLQFEEAIRTLRT